MSGARAPDRLCEARPGRLPRLDDQQNTYLVLNTNNTSQNKKSHRAFHTTAPHYLKRKKRSPPP
ncbi:hypothetical protein GCM10027288_04900 [Bordetella tumbae]